jgi:hypothetical protein
MNVTTSDHDELQDENTHNNTIKGAIVKFAKHTHLLENGHKDEREVAEAAA